MPRNLSGQYVKGRSDHSQVRRARNIRTPQLIRFHIPPSVSISLIVDTLSSVIATQPGPLAIEAAAAGVAAAAAGIVPLAATGLANDEIVARRLMPLRRLDTARATVMERSARSYRRGISRPTKTTRHCGKVALTESIRVNARKRLQ